MRHPELLRSRYRSILGYTGLVFLVSALALLATLLALPFYPEEAAQAPAFLLPGGLLAATGALLRWRFDPATGTTLTWQEGAVVVVLGWCGAIVAGAAVFMLAQDLTVTQAVFEATSGWTTTGLSVVDVTQASHLVLLLRSLLEYAGGAGLAIIMLSTLAGPTGGGLSTAEGRGDPLVPHVRRSARIVLALYTAYAVGGTLGLYAAGMGWFDAVNHALAAVSTGGFSTRPTSIGFWDSGLVEAVTIVLMVLGTMNFLTAWALARGKLATFLRNGEIHLAVFLTAAGAVSIFASVAALFPEAAKAVRVGLFEAVTALSTTGFSTVGYAEWPVLPVFVLLLLMLVGGGTGSTAGGIKQYRIYILARGLAWEVQQRVLPAAAVTEREVWVGDRRRFLTPEEIRAAGVFVFLYLATFVLGAGVIAAHGYSLTESLFEFASALGTVGLSLGVTAADAPLPILWAEIAGMLLGRLEFFTIAVGVARIVQDGRIGATLAIPSARSAPREVRVRSR